MEYEKIETAETVKVHALEDKKIIEVPAKIFEILAEKSFTEMRYFFPLRHLENWKKILESPDSSVSEKEKMYRNFLAAIESKNKKVPYCQDCGTDSAYIARGNQAVVSEDIFHSIQLGATSARKKNPFRNSVFVPTENFKEKNSGDNSPCEVHLEMQKNPTEISGVFSNKGGGSGSKLWSFSEKPSLYQDRKKCLQFLCETIAKIGHSACPPYNLKIVLGGLSHLQNSKYLTLATVESYDWSEDEAQKCVRDEALEQEIQAALKASDLGAQGEGEFFLMPEGIKIFRAPRHAAHFFVGVGISCSAHRVQRFKINESGVFLEKLCKTPEDFLPKNVDFSTGSKAVHVDLNSDRATVLSQLRRIKAGETFEVSGKILGARDKAHARWVQNFEAEGSLPEYLQKYLSVFYVGPSDTPAGEVIGSFGPTTAARMDEFAGFLGEQNVLPLSIAKGSRSVEFAQNCKKYQSMFACIQGGPASFLRNFVTAQSVIDFEDLDMEAVRLYEVKDMPVQMIVDSQGRDFYQALVDGFLDKNLST